MSCINGHSFILDQTISCRRKKVGVMATEKWGPKFPKFNSPQMKAELSEFAAKIAPTCGMPEAGFNEDGIAKHIQDFCNEQRRYHKMKTSKVHVLPFIIYLFICLFIYLITLHCLIDGSIRHFLNICLFVMTEFVLFLV